MPWADGAHLRALHQRIADPDEALIGRERQGQARERQAVAARSARLLAAPLLVEIAERPLVADLEIPDHQQAALNAGLRSRIEHGRKVEAAAGHLGIEVGGPERRPRIAPDHPHVARALAGRRDLQGHRPAIDELARQIGPLHHAVIDLELAAQLVDDLAAIGIDPRHRGLHRHRDPRRRRRTRGGEHLVDQPARIEAVAADRQVDAPLTVFSPSATWSARRDRPPAACRR